MINKYMRVLRSDAQEALSTREILVSMHGQASDLGIKGPHPSANIFNTISAGLTTSGLMALARLHDTGKDAISIPRAARNRNITQPPEIRKLRRQLSEKVLINLAAWRTNLYAHSLQNQIDSQIDQDFPLINSELDEFIMTSCAIVNLYSKHNSCGSSCPVIASDPITQKRAALMVEHMFSA